MQKINLDRDLIPFIKVNSKWVTDIKCKMQTVKFLEVNMEKTHNLEYVKNFLDMMTPKA